MTTRSPSLFVTAFLGFVSAAHAISIGPGGSGWLTFDAAPVAADWTTQSIGGEGGNAIIFNEATFDAQVQLLAASDVNRALASTAVVPPAQNNYARWNSAGRYLQTRIGNNTFTALMATLQNDTGISLSFLTVSCDVGGGLFIPEEVPGYRVYFSLTGVPGTWENIPELTTTVTGAFTATLNLGSWAPGSSLYLLWADDNSTAGSDGYYTIDNVEIFSRDIAGVAITQPANGRVFPLGVPVTITASPHVPAVVTNVDFFADGILLGGDTTPPFGLVWTNATLGAHSLTAVAQDSTGVSVTSPPVAIVVQPNLPPQVSFDYLAPGAACIVGDYRSAAVTATDPDGVVARVEFYRDGTLAFTDTHAPFGITLVGFTAGVHTIAAVAEDDGGLRTTNRVSVSATNPPGVTVLVPNGSRWKYIHDGSDQGTAWRELDFDDAGWLEGLGELGYGGDAAAMPEATVVDFGSDPMNKPITAYFRRSFVLGDPAWITNLVVRLMRDDGGVVYLNGLEVFRSGMPAGWIDSWTLAEPIEIGYSTLFLATNVSPALLVAGANLLAVEVHQHAPYSAGMSFDLMLWAQPAAPELRVVRHSADAVEITWPRAASGFGLKSSRAVNGAPWEPVPEADTPSATLHHVRVPITSGQRFFRLENP